MVRLILVFFFIVVFLLVTLPLLFVLWIIGFKRPDIKERVSLAVIRWVFRVIAWLAGVRLTITGQENLPKDESVLFIGNHRSYFDIVLTYACATAPMGFISKKQVGYIPILNLWMKNLHCLFLDRDDLKQGLQTILTACDLIKQGVSIVIYPEGTRNKTEDALLPFHKGSFKIAQKTGCKIIPVTVSRTDDIYESHKPFIRSTAVTMHYGEPVDVASMDTEERKHLDTTVHAIIEKTYLEMVNTGC